MTPSNDPIDQFIPELGALLRRVFEAGSAAGIQRLVTAAQTEPVGHTATGRRRGPDLVLPGVAPTDVRPSKRAYPYGLVKNTVGSMLVQNPGGLTRQQVATAAHTFKGVTIDDQAVKNALKSMRKHNEAISREGLWFPGPKLKAK